MDYHKARKGPQRTPCRREATNLPRLRTQRFLVDWLIGRCGELPHARQGEVLPAPRHVCDVPEGRRGRTHRTYRTAANAALHNDFAGRPAGATGESVVRGGGLPKPKRGVRSPPRPYRPPGRTCALRARTARPHRLLCVLCVLCDFQLFWQSACASTPLICNKSAKSAVPLRRALCVPLWFFVSLAVEGLALWACTVIAAQRPASSPPKAAARASTSGAPPSLQTSKPPSFPPHPH